MLETENTRGYRTLIRIRTVKMIIVIIIMIITMIMIRSK